MRVFRQVRRNCAGGAAPADAGTTLTVKATADAGGMIARVGQRMLEGVARMTLDRFFACLASRVSAE
jgi:carbon monoxide dehydrogenase subunit G